MRVAKFKSEIVGLSKKDIDESIEIINGEPLTDEPKFPKKGPLNLNSFALWSEFDLPKIFDGKDDKAKDIAKQRYEWFVAGYLYFYDVEIRNNAVNHVVYFKWDYKKKNLRVLLSPKPIKNPKYKNSTTGGRTDPPPPPPPPPPPMG